MMPSLANLAKSNKLYFWGLPTQVIQWSFCMEQVLYFNQQLIIVTMVTKVWVASYRAIQGLSFIA